MGNVIKFLKKWWWLLLLPFLLLLKPFRFITNNWRSGSVGDNQLIDIADAVHNTMLDWGTKEDKLFELLSSLNAHNLKKVYRYFGVRNYGINGRSFGLGYQYDLFEWFGAELNRKEKAQMRELWAKTGMELNF